MTQQYNTIKFSVEIPMALQSLYS